MGGKPNKQNTLLFLNTKPPTPYLKKKKFGMENFIHCV